MQSFFTGACTALVTPFYQGKISFSCLEKLVLKQIDAKISAIIVAGSTGEGKLLTEMEYEELVKFLVSFTKGNIPIVGTCNATSLYDSLKIIDLLQSWGAQGIMCPPPSYILPCQEGIFQYFYSLSIASSVPLILYNIPKRTGIELKFETIQKLQELKNVKAVKDATTDLSRILHIKNTEQGKNLKILCGNDIDAIAFNANGGDGIISVASNIAPFTIKNIQDYCLKGQYQEALKEHGKLLSLYNLLSYCGNPVSIKYCMYAAGLIKSPELKLPLSEPSILQKKYIENEIKSLQYLLE